MSELTPDEKQQILEVAHTRGKVQAVKFVRGLKGYPLSECKQAVDALMNIASGDATAIAAMDSNLSDQQLDQVLDALSDGKKIQAIKHYKEATGRSLSESKKLVEQIQKEMGIESSASGCASSVLLFIVLGTGLAALAI